jgi:hypothetical protein
MGSVISHRIIGYVYILIQILVHGVVADQASSSFEVPLKRRKKVGVFAPVEDAQGNLIPYTECVLILVDFDNE